MNRCSHHLRRCEDFKIVWICELVLGASELGLSKGVIANTAASLRIYDS
jgi:hypothetical protein